MASSLHVEDWLDGASNFSAWKARVVLFLNESELWDIVESTDASLVPIPTDATTKDAYEKKIIKAQQILLDAIKDRIIPTRFKKSNAYEMCDALTKLYQSSNENRKMVLHEKLKSIKLVKDEKMVTYLTRITRVRDELAAVGEKVEDGELVRQALNGVTKSWAILVESIVAREKLPKWNRLWDDFTQEETRRGYIQGSSSIAPVE